MASRVSSNFFEDFSVGQKMVHRGARTVTTGDNALYIALTGDRFPTYCDASFAKSLGYNRELIHDLLVFNIVFGKTVQEISFNAVANLGYADVQFRAPVYPGDTLRSETTIIGLKENSSGKNGNVFVKTEGLNQHGEVVLSFNRWAMVHKRDFDIPCDIIDVPDLPNVVTPDLSLPASNATDWVDGAFYEDYAENEWLYDGFGMTLKESEHAMATRLYQNNAKVHFNAQMMAETPNGKRLVYGGHVISLTHSLLYSIMPNAARIAAWNGGSHTNPIFANDSLYAAARILEKKDLEGRSDFGLARVQLVCLKDTEPNAENLELKQTNPDTGKSKYASHVVLDLDYWLVLPKKG